MGGVIYVGYWLLGSIPFRYHVSSECHREASTVLSMGAEYALWDVVNCPRLAANYLPL